MGTNSREIRAAASPAYPARNLRIGACLAAIAVLVVLFLPLFAIQIYGETLTQVDGLKATQTTVGIAVILRATARRLLRGASSNLMRTTVGALGRTSARAMTRRFVKFAGRMFFGSMVSQAADAAETDEEGPVTKGSQVMALGIGFIALCLSFRGILYAIPDELSAELLQSTGLGATSASLIAGLPLLAYASLHMIFGSRIGVKTRYRTEFDGLLLQAYFTGAGSFLPLTTDVEYKGSDLAKRRLATVSILGMFAFHIVCKFVGESVGSDHLTFLGSVSLLYTFVYCFPIRPLEGQFIWSSNRWLWLAVSAPIFAAFLFWLPPVLGEIL